MAIVRRKHFLQSGKIKSDDIALIDTPEKLLSFADNQQLQLFPLDVATVAEKLGIDIQYVSIEEDISGTLCKKDDGSWRICVNKEHHPNRQRYTIAHEIAHFCLHRHLKEFFEDKIFFRGGESSKAEWQANDFASTILMPEEKFIERIRAGVTRVEDLAKEFKVSTLALRIRAKNIGFSGHGL